VASGQLSSAQLVEQYEAYTTANVNIATTISARLLAVSSWDARLYLPRYRRCQFFALQKSVTLLLALGIASGGGTCANGQICQFTPTMMASRVAITGSHFPVTVQARAADLQTQRERSSW